MDDGQLDIRQETEALDSLRDSLIRANPERPDCLSIDIQKIAGSPLARKYGVFGLVYRLFPHDSPWINLGNGLTFTRQPGPIVSKDFICTDGPEKYRPIKLIEITKTDSGNSFSGGVISWRHRQDIDPADLSVMLAGEYRRLHEETMLRDEQFSRKFRANGTSLEIALLTGYYEVYPKQMNTLRKSVHVIPDNSSLKELVSKAGSDFYSLSFNNSLLCCGIAGEAGYVGHFEKYVHSEGMVFVYTPKDFISGDYVREWIRDLIDKTSFVTDPKNKRLANTLEKFLPSFGLGPKLISPPSHI